VKVALAQINPTIGDFPGNVRKIVERSREARDRGAQLAVFSELAVCGYPPADLLEIPSFVAACHSALEEIAAALAPLADLAILCGCPTPAPADSGKRIMNSAVLLRGGRVEFVQSKMLLPYYDVFDEQRYFAPAESQTLYELAGERLAITVCEDAWNDDCGDPRRQRLYATDPVEALMKQGASLFVNISASPYWRGKQSARREMIAAIARRFGVPAILVNQVGGNDSLIFYGDSFAVDADGKLIAQAAGFREDLVVVDMATRSAEPEPSVGAMNEDAAVYEALVLGTRDYVRKCGFSRAIVGLSGGIDSALVAAIAADALGSENVVGVGMPSGYSSQGSVEDARQLARNLGIHWETIPIGSIFGTFGAALEPSIGGSPSGLTEENLQPRIRGTLLMALANTLSALVLATGNKSELSTGYCTLYGDMVGALAVIGDVYKTGVYRLARYVNREREIIPRNTLEKPPSAELRPGQQDTDSLPPYDVLDPILEAFIERHESAEEIAASGRTGGPAVATVHDVLRMVERSEYKRRQAAPVLKVTPKSFGFGRRFPIAAKVRIRPEPRTS
jgi:NAD+ synthetase